MVPLVAAAAMASATGAAAPAQSSGKTSGHTYGQTSGQTSDPRLKPAAHEFEACLMKEFLQPLEHDALFDDKSDPNSGEGSDSALMSFGSEALAKAISERGGFGIATKIIGHFKQGSKGSV
jgi:Rod binding domain-containing protein